MHSTSAVNAKLRAGDAWGEEEDWGDLDVPLPKLSPRHTPTRAKPAPKLSISKKRGGKGD
jgi:hypothetical protein